jgi:hypothetical protein
MTFAYNESFFLPRWVDYYSSQLGAENLFVLDHGSTDLSTIGLGRVNIIKVPRTVYDEVQRVLFASQMHGALLQYYACGFAMDVDEFIVADPARYENLPILFQRQHVLFDSWMCKRSFSRKPIRFGGGFHTSDQPVEFDPDLYLIHLKNFDYEFRLVRQQITAAWTYAGDYGEHARKSLESVHYLFDGIDDRDASGTTSAEFNFDKELAVCRDRAVLNPSGEYDFNLQGGLQSAGLRLLPTRFRGLF